MSSRAFCCSLITLATFAAWLVIVAPAPAARDYRSGDYWAFVDRRQADVESRWRANRGWYRLPQDVRLNADMLTVHAIAALAGHNGPSRQDARVPAIARVLTSFPAYVDDFGQLGSVLTRHQAHAPGWTPTARRVSIGQHVSLDPKVAEALAYAYRARELVGIDTVLAARIAETIHDTAASAFFAYPAVRLNQFNWPADLYVADVRVSGDASRLADYRAQLGRFVAGVRQPLTQSGSTNLNDGLGLRYLPNCAADCIENRVSTSEYGNIILSGLIHYDWALAQGMAPLSLGDERLLRQWAKRVLFGEWTHAGYLNWDTGLGFRRWHLERYWAFAQYGLDTLVSARRLAFTGLERAWAKWIIDRGFDTYERWIAAFPDRMLPSTMWDLTSDQAKPHSDPWLISSRFAAHAARVAMLGVGELPSAQPPAYYAYDPEIQRLAVSTRRYATAITDAHPVARYGGLELARLYNAGSYPVSGTGGRARAAFGLAFAHRGRVLLDTQSGGGDASLADATPLRVASDNGASLRGTFRHELSTRTSLRNRVVAVLVAHRFSPAAVTVTRRVRARVSGTVTLRFPVYGDHGRVRALRSGHRLHGLLALAEHGGYRVRIAGLPRGARLRVAAVTPQPSAPHTRRVAQVRFSLRRGAARTVVARIAPF